MNGETIKGSVNEFLPAKTLPVPSNGLTRNAKFPKSRTVHFHRSTHIRNVTLQIGGG